jgi:hypothetical protein
MALQIDTLAKCALGSSDVKPGQETVRDGAEGTGDFSGFGSPISLDGQDANDMAICLSSNAQTFATEGGPEADMECGSEDGESNILKEEEAQISRRTPTNQLNSKKAETEISRRNAACVRRTSHILTCIRS